VERVLDSGWLTMGPEVARFEEDFAAHVGAEHAVAVSSCTAGIELALRALELPAGSRILTSTLTFCGAVQAIIHAGLVPVLCDVDAATLMPDARTVEEAITLNGKVEAIVLVHFAGHPAPVNECAAAAGLPAGRIVEDAAHALGAYDGDHHIGTGSAASCFSFYATKNLPIGEGGMVITPDDRLADSLRRMRLHGMSRDAWGRYLPGGSWNYDVTSAGLKANMTDVQAAIGRAHLGDFPTWQIRRQEIVERYDAALSSVRGVQLPHRPARGRHAWHLYVIRIQRAFGRTRDELFRELGLMGIQCSVHFIPVHRLTYFAALTSGVYPNADAAFEEVLSLPLHPWLNDADVDRITNAIISLAERTRLRGEEPS
jgi:dTDP-4-amino-4,6-dideoxygalactose transaminase